MSSPWSEGWQIRALGLLTAVALTALAGCGGDPVARPTPPGGEPVQGVRQVPLRPGEPMAAQAARENPHAGNQAAVEDGRRLYQWMNCVGCHFDGGGGMGPPLMDEKWIYGSAPEQIFDTIVNGRPNGMPAYGDKLAADEIWRIVAYVETLERPADEDDRQKGADGQ